jgi:hypothetical protein
VVLLSIVQHSPALSKMLTIALLGGIGSPNSQQVARRLGMRFKEASVSKIVIGFSVMMSLLCMMLAAAPFTPAVGISFLLLLLAGFMGFKGFIQSALVLLLINTLAVIASPSIDILDSYTLIAVLIFFPVSFGGVLLGLRKML